MKEALSQTLVAFFGLCLAAKAQSFDAMRPDAVYDPETVLDPASLLYPATYRKVRVYGFLRFGTEANHAGVQKYELPGGSIISGH